MLRFARPLRRHVRSANRDRRAAAIVVLVLAFSGSARALDRQISAHEGTIQVSNTGLNLSGTLLLGVSVFNPTYAARPDNTGLALMRYATHLDIDLIGSRLSIPVDINMFTDRTRGGASVLSPTEFDVIAGLLTTNSVGVGAIEAGVRFENDRPIDRGTFTQSYADARVRYLYSLAEVSPTIRRALRQGDVSGWLTLGCFFYNPTYAARPDNSGIALFRYAFHTEVSTFRDLFSIGLDLTMFTDRRSHAARPSELDFTIDLIFHVTPFEVHVAYERDLPIGRGTFVQQFVYLLAGWRFDLRERPHRAMTDSTPVQSP